ncbi:hypothetical protein EET67_11415 [Pseudaminobacter arsenicus]|uniref:Uncharacterized protein n=1 Tax=Borborobacter arsenicus TaxID=1851146 RepID=A0A432V6A1_9HYPH|nr:hypothetical protein [Pseudaminobacter arsenicus]RUM97668.1 hypothetical protein EET67_11415 [Pseudaminobacter arsenicus]
MEHIAALLLIIGCSGDFQECHELPAPVPIYETMEECDAVLPDTLREFSGRKPHVVAQCVYVDPAMEEEDAVLTWDIRPDGTLDASVGPAEVVVASNPVQPSKKPLGQE